MSPLSVNLLPAVERSEGFTAQRAGLTVLVHLDYSSFSEEFITTTPSHLEGTPGLGCLAAKSPGFGRFPTLRLISLRGMDAQRG